MTTDLLHRFAAPLPPARPPGLEPGACGLEAHCSVQLSYGRSNTSQYDRRVRLSTATPVSARSVTPIPAGTGFAPVWGVVPRVVSRAFCVASGGSGVAVGGGAAVSAGVGTGVVSETEGPDEALVATSLGADAVGDGRALGAAASGVEC
jgi:hypothetical protein